MKHSPCEKCEHSKECSLMCEQWKEWFREEWQRVTDLLRTL